MTLLLLRSSIGLRQGSSVELEDGEEGFLGDFDVADLLHALLAFLLLLEELALAADVASVALGGDILAYLLDGLAGDDLPSDGCLDGDVELLTGDELLELLAHAAAELVGVVDMGEGAEGIDGLAVEQDVELDELGGTIACRMIVEGGVASGDALELVVEVDDDLAEGHEVGDLYPTAADVLLLDELASLAETERHDGAYVVGGGDDGGADVGLLDMVDERGVGHAAGIVHLGHRALLVVDVVGDVGDGGDDAHVELAVEAFLDDLHVEQAEEAAAEAEAEGERRLGEEREGGIVELELLERGAQVLIVLGLDGIDAGEHHRLRLLEAFDGLRAGTADVGDGVAHLHLGAGLDAADDVAHIACAQLAAGYHVHLEHAHLVGNVLLACVEELHLVASADDAVDHLEVGDDAAERVEHGVEDEALERGFLVALGTGYALDDSAQDLVDAHACLRAGADNLVALTAEQVDDLVLDGIGVGAGHVALVDDGDDLEVVLDGHVEVADGLRLHALRGIHHEQGALAGGDAAGDLVGEVDVSRGVDEVEHVGLAVELVLHLYGVALDGDAALALEVHIVEHLPFGDLDGVGELKQTVGKRRLAVIDVGDDAEVAYMFHQDDVSLNG